MMNENKSALKWLKKSAEDGNPCYPEFKNDANLQNLRSDPEFQAFILKLQGEYERNRALLKP